MMLAPFLKNALPQPDADALYQAMLHFAGSPWPLADRGTLHFAEVLSAHAADLLSLRTGGGRKLFFQWLDFPMQAVTGVELAPEVVAYLPAPLRLALYRGLLTHLFSLLPGQGLLASGADPQAAVFADAVPDTLHFLEITAKIEGIGIFAFRLGATTADLVAEFRPPSDADPERSLARQVFIPFDIRIATLVLTEADAAGLETGDLLVLPRELPPPALCGFGQIVALEPAETGDARIKAGAPQGAAEADKSVPSGWARLDIITGHHRASLGAVEHWVENSPVGLPFPIPEEGQTASVSLRGSPLGRGEFLRLDERIALRITSLVAKTGTRGMEET